MSISHRVGNEKRKIATNTETYSNQPKRRSNNNVRGVEISIQPYPPPTNGYTNKYHYQKQEKKHLEKEFYQGT